MESRSAGRGLAWEDVVPAVYMWRQPGSRRYSESSNRQGSDLQVEGMPLCMSRQESKMALWGKCRKSFSTCEDTRCRAHSRIDNP